MTRVLEIYTIATQIAQVVSRGQVDKNDQVFLPEGRAKQSWRAGLKLAADNFPKFSADGDVCR